MGFDIKEIATKPFEGQKPGTSGLRKRSDLANATTYIEAQVAHRAC